MLEAMRCVANTNRPDASVAQLANDEKSLQRFAFLRGLAPTIRATEFARRATSAYSRWPKELLEQQLNHDALTSSVQHALFEENQDGWKGFCDAHPEKGDMASGVISGSPVPNQMGRVRRKAGLALASAGFELLNRGRLQRWIFLQAFSIEAP
jgi:hypothetical protein